MMQQKIGELMILTGSIHDLAEICADPWCKSKLMEIAAKQEEHLWSLRLRINYLAADENSYNGNIPRNTSK